MNEMTDKTDQFEELAKLVLDLLTMLESMEESDSGREFHPTTISSCRVMHTQRLSEILPRMKELAMPEPPKDVKFCSECQQPIAGEPGWTGLMSPPIYRCVPCTLKINPELKTFLERPPHVRCPKCDSVVLPSAFYNGWAICSVCSQEIEQNE
jgi:hypothetical protein